MGSGQLTGFFDARPIPSHASMRLILFQNPSFLTSREHSKGNNPSLSYPGRLQSYHFARSRMPEYPSEPYQFETPSTQTSFRIVELLPGRDEEDPVSCLIHIVDLLDPLRLRYEAVSYDASCGDDGGGARALPVICNGKRLEVGLNLYRSLVRLRFKGESRFLWVDGIW